MSMIINAPTARVATYDVANQTDVQFNFDFDPTQMRADGTTLVVEYEGSEIRLENFFDADGNALVDNFLTQDGQAFSAAEFLAAIMGPDGGATAEDIETAANAAASGSGAGDYSDDAGNLYAGLNALGGQGDAYDQEIPDPVEEVPGDTRGGSEYYYDSDDIWWEMKDAAGAVSFENRQYMGSGTADPTADYAVLMGHNRTYTDYVGTSGVDTLYLTDDNDFQTFFDPLTGFSHTGSSGDALLLEDFLSFGDHEAHVQGIEVIYAGDGGDVIDLSSSTLTYGDVTVYGEQGDDIIWTNAGNDTLYGGTGDDSLVSGSGDDVVYGGTGDDVIKGLGDADFLNGGEGNDTIFGGSGDDQVNAGTGYHDVVTLGTGADTLIIDASSVTDGNDSDLWSNTDGVDAGTSAVEVLDFGNTDTLELDSGYSILDVQIGDANGDGLSDIALFVGESVDHNNTWVVLSDVDLNTTDLSQDMYDMIVAAGGIP